MGKLFITSDLALRAEAYFSAIQSGNAAQAENAALQIWSALERFAIDEACRQVHEFEQNEWQQKLSSLGREKFVGLFTDRRVRCYDVKSTIDQIEAAFNQTMRFVILDVVVSGCQRAATDGDPQERQRLFYLLWSLIQPYIEKKLAENPHYARHSCRIVTSVESKLDESLGKPDTIRYIYGFLDTLIRQEAWTQLGMEKRHQEIEKDRLSARLQWNPDAEKLCSLKETWDVIKKTVKAIDRDKDGGKSQLNSMFHMELTGRGQDQIKEDLRLPSQETVSKKLQYLYDELLKRLPPAVCAELHLLEVPSRKRHREIFQQVKEMVE